MAVERRALCYRLGLPEATLGEAAALYEEAFGMKLGRRFLRGRSAARSSVNRWFPIGRYAPFEARASSESPVFTTTASPSPAA